MPIAENGQRPARACLCADSPAERLRPDGADPRESRPRLLGEAIQRRPFFRRHREEQFVTLSALQGEFGGVDVAGCGVPPGCRGQRQRGTDPALITELDEIAGKSVGEINHRIADAAQDESAMQCPDKPELVETAPGANARRSQCVVRERLRRYRSRHQFDQGTDCWCPSQVVQECFDCVA